MGCAASLGTSNSAGIDSSERSKYSGLSTNCRISALPSSAIRSISCFGKKHGVSHNRNCTCVPHASSTCRKKVWYFSGVKFSLNCLRKEGIILVVPDRRRIILTPGHPERSKNAHRVGALAQSKSHAIIRLTRLREEFSHRFLPTRFHQKLPLAHDLLVVHPDIKLPSHDVNMRRRIPLCAGMRSIRVSKRNMHSGILLILQNLSDHVLQINIRPDGELPNAIAVLVGMCIPPEILLQFAVIRMGLG